jgi:hypothetical protein
MAVSARDLLQACQVAEGILANVPDGTERAAVELALARIRARYHEGGSGRGDQAVTDVVEDALTQSVQLLASVQRAAGGGTRIEVLLATWRDAEKALAAMEPGSSARLVACRAVEAAKAAYQARIRAVDQAAEQPGGGPFARRTSAPRR